MLTELLQDRAALYVAGALSAEEREAFEVLVEFDPQLGEHVAALREATAAVLVQRSTPAPAVPQSLKSRILAAAEKVGQQRGVDALVVTDAEGHIVWVNGAFTDLCGYSLDELRGQKPGRMLQGPATEAPRVEEIRQAVRSHRPCRVELTNYHKNGAAYRAEVRINPFLDDEAQPVWFVARERKLT